MAIALQIPQDGRSLNVASTTWFRITALGQWFYLIHLLAAYPLPAFVGKWEAWESVFPRRHLRVPFISPAFTFT